jgi:hypothetical protein
LVCIIKSKEDAYNKYNIISVEKRENMLYYKGKNKRMDSFMKPRIFVSSTFYDLKYAREDLSNFIKAHGFDPIMFENGDIGYTSGKALDDACYEAMKSADMAILIIGGNYGSAATGESPEVKDYMSITRKEFKTAMEFNIPIYVFIESKVHAEYDVYEMNISSIEENNEKIQFKATKDLNVFRFIKEIKKIGNVPITEFTKPSEIKEFLGKQWSDMFKAYLSLLRENGQTKSLDDRMNEMRILISKMELMINGIGKKVLNDSDDYDEILREQKSLKYCEEITSSFKFEDITSLNREERNDFLRILLKVLEESNQENIWPKIISDVSDDNNEFFDFFNNRKVIIESILPSFSESVEEIVEFIGEEKNREKLIENLMKDTYFDEMVSII